MASHWETTTALGVIGLSTFQLAQLWTDHAPALSAVRNAGGNDLAVAQQLMDAEFLVGGFVVLIGAAFIVLTGDWIPLVLLGLAFGALVGWYHQVLTAHAVS